MKNVVFLGLTLLIFWGCQSPSRNAQKNDSPSVRIPSNSEEDQDFYKQSHDKCRYENGTLYNDDYKNSICVRNYRSADRRNHDVILTFNFTTEPEKGESRRITSCTRLSANQGEESYLCEIAKRYFYLAHYQRGYYTDNRIWLEEIPANRLKKMLDQNQEDYRYNLKIKHGQFELKPNDFSRNREFLGLMK